MIRNDSSTLCYAALPNVDKIMEIVGMFADVWRDLGRRVFIPDTALDAIEEENKSNWDRLRATLVYMLYKHPEPCWRILLRIENLFDCSEYQIFRGLMKMVFDKAKEYAEKITGQVLVCKIPYSLLIKLTWHISSN